MLILTVVIKYNYQCKYPGWEGGGGGRGEVLHDILLTGKSGYLLTPQTVGIISYS